MVEYLIQDKTLTSIANPIRDISGTLNPLSPNDMANKLQVVGNEIDTQSSLIAQIQSALENKATMSGINTCTVNVHTGDEGMHITAIVYQDGQISRILAYPANNTIQSRAPDGAVTEEYDLSIPNVVCGTVLILSTGGVVMFKHECGGGLSISDTSPFLCTVNVDTPPGGIGTLTYVKDQYFN